MRVDFRTPLSVGRRLGGRAFRFVSHHNVIAAILAAAGVILAAYINGYYQDKISQAETRSAERIEAERRQADQAIEAARREAAEASQARRRSEEDEARQRRLDRALTLVSLELEENGRQLLHLGTLDRLTTVLSARSRAFLPSRVWHAQKGILADELAFTKPVQWNDISGFYLELQTYRTALAALPPNEPLNRVEQIWAAYLCDGAGQVRPLPRTQQITYTCAVPSGYDPLTDIRPSVEALLRSRGAGES